MKTSIMAGLVLLTLTAPVNARYDCGRTVKGMFSGLPKGINFNLAREWLRLRHIPGPQAGAAVVSARKGRALGGGPGGHVAKILVVHEPCKATVADDKGTYVRNICKNLLAYVQP